MKHGSPMYEVKGGEVCSDLGSSTEGAIRGCHVKLERRTYLQGVYSKGSVPTFVYSILTC